MEEVVDTKMEHAKQKAKAKIEFIEHFLIYIVVNPLLVILNLLVSPGFLWSFIVIVGWGIGLAGHFLSAFVFTGMLKGLEQKFIDSELKK